HVAEHLEQAAELVGELLAHTHQLGSRGKQSTRAVAALALDLDFAIPARPYDLGEAERVVGVRLVDLHGQCRLCMPGVDACYRQAHSAQGAPMPSGHRASLQGDASDARCPVIRRGKRTPLWS